MAAASPDAFDDGVVPSVVSLSFVVVMMLGAGRACFSLFQQ